jgi:Rad52/22 family double-strand break repair protein
MFTEEQLAELKKDLDRANVRTREQGRTVLSYIEGWKAIEEANRIFGFDAWNRETVELKMVVERERPIGKRGDKGWSVSYIARVKITVFSRDGNNASVVTREGVGSGHGIDRSLGLAHESAVKEAETDATKRALTTFGYAFGLALYDKAQGHVSDTNGDAGDDADDERARGNSTTSYLISEAAKKNGADGQAQISSGDDRMGPEDDPPPEEHAGTRAMLKAEYLASCRDLIKRSTNADALRTWWFSEDSKKARDDYKLAGNELKDLSVFCKARIDTLSPPNRGVR